MGEKNTPTAKSREKVSCRNQKRSVYGKADAPFFCQKYAERYARNVTFELILDVVQSGVG